MSEFPKQPRVFVVDDEDVIASSLAMILRFQGGFHATSFTDPLKALKAAQAEAPDLLITDVGLPGLSGIRLAEAARVWRPDLPILIITGYVGKSLETLRLAPNIEVLRKPFTLDELAARVQALLKRAASAR